MKKDNFRKFLFIIFFIGILLLIPVFLNPKAEVPLQFDPQCALQHVQTQVEFGPRTPGSIAHQKTIAYIQKELGKTGWAVEIQQTELMGHPISNIIAKRGKGSEWIILGAHFDSRFFADHDENAANQNLPVPGANDGASGVAVLLELARVMPKSIDQEIWLVFFDAEDQGRIEGWDWILGSRAFADSLTSLPDSVVVIDMIGDSDLTIYREKSSDQTITDSIWQKAADLGYEKSFINEEKYSILDDHLPFLELGIPAIDIIDFDYPYWHTIADTVDKVSAESLSIVGNTLLSWLEDKSDIE